MYKRQVQYSRRGRTYVMKPLIRLLISLERKHFNIKFATLCPLTVNLATCLESLRRLSTVTPKSTTSCTAGKAQLSLGHIQFFHILNQHNSHFPSYQRIKPLKTSLKLTLVDGDVCITEHNETNGLHQQQKLNCCRLH